ncbi:MAG: GNAT family N-acetyltransferase [Bryobacteraceae bacterium]|nr:GNAT family N-acetyltransferase [Bryobacteraceae bacterium]
MNIDAHHRRKIRSALRHVNVERCSNLANFGEDWVRLYANLAKRHKMSAFSDFPRSSLLNQLAVPGLVAYRAEYLGHTVGAVLCFIQGEIAYYHLGAYSDEGYRLGASFALFDEILRSLRTEGVRWLSLGAGAGTETAIKDGLTRFKHGWTSETRTVYLCGRIYNILAYEELVKARGIARGTYFPLYRQGETVREPERE